MSSHDLLRLRSAFAGVSFWLLVLGVAMPLLAVAGRYPSFMLGSTTRSQPSQVSSPSSVLTGPHWWCQSWDAGLRAWTPLHELRGAPHNDAAVSQRGSFCAFQTQAAIPVVGKFPLDHEATLAYP